MKQSSFFYIGLILVSSFCLWLGQFLGGRQGLLIGFSLVFALNFYIYFLSDYRIRKSMQSKEILGHDPWGLTENLHDLCRMAYIPVPKLYSSPLASPTSISFGTRSKNASIVISERLIKVLNKDDLRSLLALEVARLKHLDSLSLTMFSSFMALVLSLSKWLDYIFLLQIFLNKNSRLMPISKISLSFMRILYGLCVPAQSYFAADKFAAKLIGEPKKIAHLIWKLESYTSTQPMHVKLDMAHLFIVNPIPRNSWYSTLEYQPNFEQRIKKLVGYFPI